MSGTTSNNANKKRFGKFAASSVPVHGKAANAGPKQHLDAVENSFQAHDPKHRQGHFEGAGEHPRTGTRGK